MTTNTQNNVAFGFLSVGLLLLLTVFMLEISMMTCDMTLLVLKRLFFSASSTLVEALIFGVLFIYSDNEWDLGGQGRERTGKGMDVNLIFGQMGYNGPLSLYT
jgi:hypothetical protein